MHNNLFVVVMVAHSYRQILICDAAKIFPIVFILFFRDINIGPATHLQNMVQR